MIKIRKKSKLSIMAFILGLLSTNNIVYVCVIGNTPILLCSLYAFICLILLMPNMKFNSVRIPVELKVCVIGIVSSIIPVLLFNANDIRRWGVGIVAFILNGMIIILVLLLNEYKENILAGVAVGIIINAIEVLVAFFFYLQGTIISFEKLFPAAGIAPLYLSNSFRGTGFFKEPGHLMRYVAIVALLVYTNTTNKKKRYILLCAIILIAAFSRSSALFFFAFGIIVFFIKNNISNPQKLKRTFLAIPVVALLIWLFLRYVPIGKVIGTSFSAGLWDIFGERNSSSPRIQGMKYTFDIIKEYFVVGCGWNMLTQIFIDMGHYGLNSVVGSYSRILSLFAELGVWAISYIWFIVSKITQFWRVSKKEINLACACSLLIYLCVYSATDYALDSGSSVFLGIIIILFYVRRTKNAVIEEISEL